MALGPAPGPSGIRQCAAAEPCGYPHCVDEKVTRDFDRRAIWYDLSPRRWQFFVPVQKAALKLAGPCIASPKTILDVGCGTGQLIRRMAKTFPNAQLFGVDASKEMVDRARNIIREGVNGRVELAAAEALPFPDSSFDLVVSTVSFHHWQDQPRGLTEIRRVLHNGGVFVLADMLASSRMRRATGFIGGGRFNTPEQLDELLAAACLDLVVRKRVPLHPEVKVSVACASG